MIHRHQTAPKPSNQIVTVHGIVFNNVFVEKVNPNGLVISYTLRNGGLGMATVDASDLSSALREKYKISLPSTGNQ